MKEVPDMNLKILKANKGASKLFSTLYFLVTTVVGYVILGPSEYLPPNMGGTGALVNLYKNHPIVYNLAYAKPLKYYYLITQGYHIASTV